jgi:hypothetical protein
LVRAQASAVDRQRAPRKQDNPIGTGGHRGVIEHAPDASEPRRIAQCVENDDVTSGGRFSANPKAELRFATRYLLDASQPDSPFRARDMIAKPDPNIEGRQRAGIAASQYEQGVGRAGVPQLSVVPRPTSWCKRRQMNGHWFSAPLKKW